MSLITRLLDALGRVPLVGAMDRDKERIREMTGFLAMFGGNCNAHIGDRVYRVEDYGDRITYIGRKP